MLLYNIAQCHRMLGELKAALATYRSFVTNAPDSPTAATAREKVVEVEKALAAQATVQNASPMALEQPENPEAEAQKASPEASDRRSFGPNVYLGGVSDPKNKEVGLEAGLVLSPADSLSIILGGAIGQNLGARVAVFLPLGEIGPLRLWAGPRLLVTPASAGASVGGGAQVRAELQAAGWLDIVLGAGAEVYKTPAETLVAPLLAGGLQTRF